MSEIFRPMPSLPRDKDRKPCITNDEELEITILWRDHYLSQSSNPELNERVQAMYYKKMLVLDKIMIEYVTQREKEKKAMPLITHHTDEGITVEITDEKAFLDSAKAVASLHNRLNDPEEPVLRTEAVKLMNQMTAHLDAQKVWLMRPQVDLDKLQRLANFVLDYYARPAIEVERDYPEFANLVDQIHSCYVIYANTHERFGHSTTKPPNGWPDADNAEEAFLKWFIVPMLKKIMGRV